LLESAPRDLKRERHRVKFTVKDSKPRNLPFKLNLCFSPVVGKRPNDHLGHVRRPEGHEEEGESLGRGVDAAAAVDLLEEVAGGPAPDVLGDGDLAAGRLSLQVDAAFFVVSTGISLARLRDRLPRPEAARVGLGYEVDAKAWK
jgi:hypothetical protein